MFRPAFPNVPSFATLNDSVVNHFWIRSACEPLVSDGFETTSAWSLPMVVSEVSSPETMFSGKPLCQFQIPVVSHPPRIGRSAPEGDGSCQTYFRTKRCFTLKSDSPRYARRLNGLITLMPSRSVR